MGKRLQFLFTTGRWVRRALRGTRGRRPIGEPEAKLRAIRHAAKFAFPAVDVERMIDQIEEGYRIDLHRL